MIPVSVFFMVSCFVFLRHIRKRRKRAVRRRGRSWSWRKPAKPSCIFEKGREYVIFLKSAGPSPALLNERGLTALEVDAVYVDMRGVREEVPVLLRRWAEMRAANAKKPGPGAAVWGEGVENRGMPASWIVFIAVMLIGMGAHASAGKRPG